jgi:hypothetical protein
MGAEVQIRGRELALPNLFSRRKRQATAGSDVYQYDICSPKLRQQIIQMIGEANRGLATPYSSNDIYEDVVKLLRKELGVPKLWDEYDFDDEFNSWFLNHDDIDELLDAVEASVGLVSYTAQHNGRSWVSKNLVEEMNARMLEAGFGFQIENGQIMQVSSQFIHAEVVVPALSLLSNSKFSAADSEFRQAHAEFRAGEYEDCIHDCANAFESVLKVILTEKGWAFSPNDTASKLIAVAFANDLIPTYMQNEFSGLRTILESGTPTVRNKSGGHGAGPNPRNIPSHIAAFQLHQTAASIVLLVKAANL